jgi:glycosyltransferase involved in cell wall biosynthesis
MFFAQRGYQKMMKHISMFIVLSNFSRDALLTFGIESKRIKLKPNFAFRSTLNGSVKPKTIIYSGRLEVDKGLPKLMEAWSQSKASKNEWTLKIAGHGSLFSEVEKFANSAKNVSFLGLLDRKTLLEEIGNSRFSIILSEALENLPMVIIESLSVGTPLIVSSNPSLQNFIEKDFTVALPKDFNSWFLTFDQLDSLNYELMSQSSLQEFNEKYSPESSLRALESIYSQVKLLE